MDIKMMSKKKREETLAYARNMIKVGAEKYAQSSGRTKDLDLMTGIIKSKPENIKFNVTGLGCDKEASVYRVKLDITVSEKDFFGWLDHIDKLCNELGV